MRPFLILIVSALMLQLMPCHAVASLKQDTVEINKGLAWVWKIAKTDRDSALRMVIRLYNQSRQINYRLGIAEAGQLIGTYETRQSHYDRAMLFYKQSVSIYKSLNEMNRLASVYIMMGVNEGMQNSSSEALHWLLLAKDQYEKSGDKAAIADVLFKIGLIYGQVNDYQNAIHYQEQSLDYALGAADTSMVINLYNNLGMLYAQNADYNTAKVVLEKARHLMDVAGSYNIETLVYHNLGNVFMHEGAYDSAYHFLQKSLDIAQQENYPIEIAGAANSLADLMVRQGKTKQAQKYIEQSLSYARRMDDKELEYQNLTLLRKVQLSLGNYKEAAEMYDTLFALNKLIENSERRALVEKTAMERIVNGFSESVQKLQAQNKARTQERNILILISTLTLLLVVLAVVAAIQTKKKNSILKEQKESLEALSSVKDKLFAIISHDLRSPLASVLGSLELLKSDLLTEDERKTLIHELELSSSATLDMLDNLLVWGAGQFTRETLQKDSVNIKEIAEKVNLLLSNVAHQKEIRLNHQVDDLCVAQFDKNQLEFILRNLVSNAIKFSSQGEEVVMRGYRENGHVVVEVKDNGIGMSRENVEQLFNIKNRVSTRGTSGEKGVGLGLVLIQEFLEKNNGTIVVESEQGRGSCFKVRIPAMES